MTETEKIFKRNLISLREGRGLSKYAAANFMKIGMTYYRGLEDMSKHKSPSYELLEKIARFYEIEVYELFKEK